jgi:tetratricopeptide (TPR) repeat protein
MKMKMKTINWYIILFGLTVVVAHAQQASPEQEEALRDSRDITWEANKELEEDQFVAAEAKYRRAISKSGENEAASYNLGNALYKKESYREAFGGFKKAGETAKGKSARHSAFHNMGNVFMKNKEYEKAVEAYKEALRNNPTDEETRYNLALAKEMLKKQQNEQENNDDKDNQDQQDQKEQNKDQQDQGDNKEQDKQQENQDQQKDEGNQGDKEKEENKKGEGDEKQEQQKQPQPDPNEQQPQEPRPNQLSPQQIQNLLEAMQNEEKKVQEKLDAARIKGVPAKSKKDW